MIEPLSLMTAAFGLFGQVQAILNDVVDKHDDFKYYSSQLGVYRALLHGYELKLERWCRHYYYDGSTDDFRRNLWGDEGLRTTRVYLEDIATEAGALCRHLYGDDRYFDPDDNTRSRLRRRLINAPEWRELQGIFQWTKFNTYKKNLLRKRVTALKALVESLIDNAQMRFELREGEPTMDHRQAVRLRTRMYAFRRAMSNAYKQRPKPDGGWGLLFSPPEDDLDCFPLETETIEIDFVYCKQRFDTDLCAYRVASSYHPETGRIDEISTCIGEGFKRAIRSEESLVLKEALKTMFRNIGNAATNRELPQQDSAQARVAIAFHIATWVSLAWETRWCRTLCSCRIHRFRGQQIAAFSRSRIHPPDYCPAMRLRHRPYFLLGILLAELALERPIIDAYFNGEDSFFELGDEEPTNAGGLESATRGGRARITKLELLQWVKNRTDRKYGIATSHCFTLDMRAQQKDTQGILRIADYESYSKNILEPLKVCQKALGPVGVPL